MEAVGGVMSRILLTVTDSEAVPEFPAVSSAVAVSVCVPLVRMDVFTTKLYGEMVSVPISVPSTMRLTEAIPEASLADTWALMVPEIVAPGPGNPMVTVGGVVSGCAVSPPPRASATALAALTRPQP